MYSRFNNSKNILISGCGGGYDIFAGLDLFFHLIKNNKNVILGSYTFTNHYLLKKYGTSFSNFCYSVEAGDAIDYNDYHNHVVTETYIPPEHICQIIGTTREQYIKDLINKNSDNVYFPEKMLVDHLNHKYGINVPIYCFLNEGIKHMTTAYNEIIRCHNIDTIILVDGGTDSLMKGCETDVDGNQALGTPYEDVSSIVAVSNSNCNNNYLYTIGYNVDSHHGVEDNNYLANTSDLIQQGYFIESSMLNLQNDTTKKYVETFLSSDPINSIVNSLIVASLQGYKGYNYPDFIKPRVHKYSHFINPLMSLYWIYDLNGVYKSLVYPVDKLKTTTENDDIYEMMGLQ